MRNKGKTRSKGKTVSKQSISSKEAEKLLKYQGVVQIPKDKDKAKEKQIRRERVSKRLSSMAWEIEKIQDEDSEYLTYDQRNKLLLIRERMRKLANQL